MGSNVFVYGTLMYPQVLQALISRVPSNTKAEVTGYRRYAIKGQVFPGVIPSSRESKVEGVVLFNLTPDEMIIFDEFEGDEYSKCDVKPQILPASENSDGLSRREDAANDDDVTVASIYIWQQSLAHLLYGEWDPKQFEETHLESYVDMCRQFAEELREQQGRPQSRPLGFQ